MAIISDSKILNIISKVGLVDNDVLQASLKTAQEKEEDFVTFLIKQNLLKAEEIGQLIANDLHIGFAYLAKEQIKLEILKLIPEIVARKQKIIAFRRDA